MEEAEEGGRGKGREGRREKGREGGREKEGDGRGRVLKGLKRWGW